MKCKSNNKKRLCLSHSFSPFLGSGEKTDGDKAIEYWTKAYENGDGFSARNCAVCYLSGRGVTQDVKKGEELMQLAEDRGCGEAALRLTDLAIRSNLGEASIRKHVR